MMEAFIEAVQVPKNGKMIAANRVTMGDRKRTSLRMFQEGRHWHSASSHALPRSCWGFDLRSRDLVSTDFPVSLRCRNIPAIWEW